MPKKFQLVLPKGYKRQPLPWFSEWITALESGKFRQGHDRLVEKKKGGHLGYCCLGILSKVQGRLVKDNSCYVDKNSGQIGDLDRYNPCYRAFDCSGKFPAGVRVEYQYSCDAGTENFSQHVSSLIGCNDDARLNFKQIASIIKRVWKVGKK